VSIGFLTQGKDDKWMKKKVRDSIDETKRPLKGHTLADTRNHHIAGQSSVGQQDRSSDECPSERMNAFDDPDGIIFDGLNIPDDVVVEVEDINIDDDNIFTDTRNQHIAGQSSVGQQDRSSDECPLERMNTFDDADGSIFDDLNISDDIIVGAEDINIGDGDIFDGVVVNE
uniref:RNA-directed DNA polymerase, eukaryota n=1 Tax=Loa loa TaxID=7209 RepID=A0A1I7VBZ8_LOALO